MSATGGAWEARWRAGDTPWDLGGPSPGLLHALGEVLRVPPALRVLVPGAGAGHDALALARAGHVVTALDLAPTAVARCRAAAQAAGLDVEVVLGDVLQVGAAHRAAFDAIFEHTCFCALDPSQRDAYAEAVARQLVPGGRLVAVLWQHGREGGPPYDVTPQDVERHLGTRFVCEGAVEVPRGGQRDGIERLYVFTLAPAPRPPVA